MKQLKPLLVMLLDRDLVALAVKQRPKLKVDPSTLLYYPFSCFVYMWLIKI